MMSRAFIREDDAPRLDEVMPTLAALKVFLTNENNGIAVYERSSFQHPENGKTVYQMSNGLSYALNDEGRWYFIEEN